MRDLLRNTVVRHILLIVLSVVVPVVGASAQSQKFEFATHFTSFDAGREYSPGFGGTFAYNVTRRVGLESTLNFFPGDPRSNFGNHQPLLLGGSFTGGNVLQGFFGAKVGILQFKKAEFFVRLKPGFTSFSDIAYRVVTGIGGATGPDVTLGGRQTWFALDFGGGAKFYPTKTVFLRFDIGDTYIRYGSFPTTIYPAGAPPGTQSAGNYQGSPAHSLQVSTGVGFRFGGAK